MIVPATFNEKDPCEAQYSIVSVLTLLQEVGDHNIMS